jgi:ABC-type phosphate transport system ATPase subunit
LPRTATVEPTAEAPRSIKDVRVDQVGYAAEIVKQHADVLKTKVKVKMLEDEVARVHGNAFEGLLIGSRKRSLDPRKLFKLVKANAITEAQFLGAVTVNLDAAKQLLSGNDLNRLCDEGGESHSLRVTLIKDCKVSPVEALRGLTAAIDPR